MIKYIITFILITTPVLAHSWYDAECCHGMEDGGDCRPVNCNDIKYTANPGYYTYKGLDYYKFQIHPSQDMQCHACYIKNISHCLYLPGNS